MQLMHTCDQDGAATQHACTMTEPGQRDTQVVILSLHIRSCRLLPRVSPAPHATEQDSAPPFTHQSGASPAHIVFLPHDIPDPSQAADRRRMAQRRYLAPLFFLNWHSVLTSIRDIQRSISAHGRLRAPASGAAWRGGEVAAACCRASRPEALLCAHSDGVFPLHLAGCGRPLRRTA